MVFGPGSFEPCVMEAYVSFSGISQNSLFHILERLHTLAYVAAMVRWSISLRLNLF